MSTDISTPGPDEESSASVPTYEGRVLPRPEEDVEDQGLRFDIGTILGRRRMLSLLGLGGVGALAACGSSSSSTGSTTATTTTTTSTGEIPEETMGPYPGDGSNGPDVLEESGVVRSDIRSSFGTSTTVAEGVPMTLRLTVTDMVNAQPFAGVAVYVWHCDRDGAYSMYGEGIEDENYLRGVQIADADGVVEFTSIYPACYSGRWPHVHFEVYPDEASITDTANLLATSQVALPEAASAAVYASTGYETSVANLAQVSLDSDNVFGDDGGATQLGTATGNVSDGYVVSLGVNIDTTTEPGTVAGSNGGGPGGAMPSGSMPSGSMPSGSMPSGTPPEGGPGGEPPTS
ncbi:intradiol ring-cleavage dioxygenase [Kineococcus gynurae]|uniref:Intradiol ring-cleavage dioxygenase n=1 Tax=Kineococcus gynurae TaxID=452979 RepID=A0ABV5LVG3_9ACTN